MGAITPSYVLDLESRMEILTDNEYARLTSNLWWQSIAKTRTTTARRDLMLWLLSTAQIRDQGQGGNIAFSDLVSGYTELEMRWAGDGLKIRRDQLEDTDGNGLDLAGQWSRDIGAYMAYWPQERIAQFLKTAHTSAFVGYDGVPFFATNHPVNPFNTASGTYANLLTGAASGVYPGALPIDDSVTMDVALQNLSKLYSYVASAKMPNGETPRFLRPKALLVPPRMYPRVVQLTSAKFIAQTAGSFAGSSDVEGLIRALNYSLPIQADELAGFEDDKTYFVAMETLASSPLGAVLYTVREPFHINYYGNLTIAELNRKDELEWHCKGRNAVSSGHPYLLTKVKGS